MAFKGEPIKSLAPLKLGHRSCELTIVSGDGVNACGHMLVRMPAETGGTESVFHIGDVHDFPYWMPASKFPLYLTDNKKKLLGRKSIVLPRSQDAEAYLSKTILDKWFWGAVANNCVSFCEEYISAGGADYTMWTNCPVQYDSQNPKEYVEGWLDDLSRRAAFEISRAIGVPF